VGQLDVESHRLPGLGSGARNEAELAFRRLPDPIIVYNPVPVGKAPFLVEFNCSPFDVLPTVVASLEDYVVGQVPCHLALVPSLAYDHEAVRGSIIV